MGDNTHPLLTGEQIDQMIINGGTYTTIAHEYGMTKEGVRRRRLYVAGVARKGIRWAPREIAEQLMPWPKGSGPDPRDSVFLALKAHSKWQVRNAEEDLSTTYRDRLIPMYRRLITEGLIVEYDATIPPGSEAGFSYRARAGSDGMLMLRRNEYTVLSDAQEDHWSFPRVMPKGAEDLVSLLRERSAE